MKTKDLDFKVKSVSEDGAFSGYASVFGNEDSYGDIVVSGAFSNSIKALEASGKKLPILWQHDAKQPIGVFDTLQEDEHGLHVTGRLLINDVRQAKEAYALLKEGVIDGLSIGYRINKSKYDLDTDVLYLHDVDLKEASIVTFPANEESRVDMVKQKLNDGELPSLSEFEKFLRESGFSKSQAVTIASHGLRSLLGEPGRKQAQLNNVFSILKS
ncbi:HK97 family phage prohead protease [Oligella urethralis]|uniref:HK97 family phage prohead protease n=1 Tax=Oligella urethralis TaxID=90245 RepID=UPI000D008F20|nr:HK97 family phage prohead protease [Oligella urethralis]AVL70861.1 HK97 family phage prohead protease [Oligella urethralis]